MQNILHILFTIILMVYMTQTIKFAYTKTNSDVPKNYITILGSLFNGCIIFFFFNYTTTPLAFLYFYLFIFFEILFLCKAHAFSAFQISNMTSFIFVVTSIICYYISTINSTITETNFLIPIITASLFSILLMKKIEYDYRNINFLKLLQKKEKFIASTFFQFYLFISNAVAIFFLSYVYSSTGIYLFILIEAILSILFFYFAYKNFIQTYFDEQSELANIQSIDYQNQLNHYSNYLSYSKNLSDFSTRYKKNMGTIYSFIQNEKYDSLYDLVLEINEDMQKNIDIHNRYSNNKYIDALLQDSANRFLQQQLPFDAIFFFPQTIDASKEDIIYMMDALLKNIEKFCFMHKERNSSSLAIISKNNNGYIQVQVSARNMLQFKMVKTYENVYILGIQNKEYIFDFEQLFSILAKFNTLVQIDFNSENSELKLTFNFPNHISN